jgi:hypothetical protein
LTFISADPLLGANAQDAMERWIKRQRKCESRTRGNQQAGLSTRVALYQWCQGCIALEVQEQPFLNAAVENLPELRCGKGHLFSMQYAEEARSFR